MTLLFILLVVWVVGAILVLAFLSGAQHLTGTDDREAVRAVNAFAPADAGRRAGLRGQLCRACRDSEPEFPASTKV